MDFRLIDGLTKKEAEYKKYINDHIALVQKVWERFKKDNYKKGEDENLLRLVDKDIKEHDLSKYVGNEFIGYRQWFYPEEGEAKNEDKFMRAWNSHQKKNSHHWQYFVMPNADGGDKVLYMGVVDILCMLSDWTAMSIQNNNSVTEWYNKNKPSMILHDDTVSMIEEFLPKFEKVFIKLNKGG